MKEIRRIVEHYESTGENVACALATVIHVEGSSYRRVGARMLVMANGQYQGGISGGCLEGDALRKAQMVINSQKSKIVRYDTRDEDNATIGIGLGCNGLIEVLISPVIHNPDLNPITKLSACLSNRAEHILITVVRNTNHTSSEGRIFKHNEMQIHFELDRTDIVILEQEAVSVKRKKRSRLVELSNMKVLIEYLPPPIHLLIFGGQYDVLPLLELKTLLGWKATLICKVQTTNTNALQLADHTINQREQFKLPEIDAYTVAILMSHDYITDLKHLKLLLSATQIQYIGLLGPKKRGDKIKTELALSESSDWERIYNPIGLDTGATTPEEIAVSMVAEIRAFFSKRYGQHLRLREQEIHLR